MPLFQNNISENDKSEFRKLFKDWLTSADKEMIASEATENKVYTYKYVSLVLEFHKQNDNIFNLAINTALKNRQVHYRKLETYKEEVA